MPSAAARSLHAARTAVMKSRNSSAVGPRAGFPACVFRGHSGKEGAHRMGQHGGQNRLSFPAWVEEYYSRKNYGERLNDRGVDDVVIEAHVFRAVRFLAVGVGYLG
jgi:hypothetical protein